MTAILSQKNFLTEAQLEKFEEQGFLQLPAVFSGDEVAKLLVASQRCWQLQMSTKSEAVSSVPDWWSLFHKFSARTGTAYFESRNIIAQDPVFMNLIDDSRVLLPMTQLLNENIAILGSHLTIRTKSDLEASELTSKRLGWHRDLGVASIDMVEPHPRLSVKAAIWLTPLAESNAGAMRVVPGSHRLIGAPAFDQNHQPFGAIELFAAPGDLLLFEQRLWHAGAPNMTNTTRICIFLCYGFRWLRPQDYRDDFDFDSNEFSDIRKQLLGHCFSQMGFHLPSQADVPLRREIEQLKRTMQ